MDDLIREARERWEQAELYDRNNRMEALTDLKFRALEQWPEQYRLERLRQGRPCLTVDQLGPIVKQVTGDIRLNPPGVKVRPVDGGADPKLAETLTGLIRNIEAQSDATGVYAAAADAQVSCGMGHFRVVTEYCGDDVWDQDIRIRHIPNPFAVLYDPAATDLVRADAKFCFVTDLMPLADFKAEFPKASITGWDEAGNTDWTGWVLNECIRVCEYWVRVPMKRRLWLLADGRTVDVTGLSNDELVMTAQQGGGVARERYAESYRVEMRKMSAVEELEDPTEWAGKYLPIIPVIGEEVFVGDRVVRSGIIRPARDAQTRYNVQTTALTEAVAMAPKPKWLVLAEQIAGYEDHWGRANVSTEAFLPYKNVPGAQPPNRVSPAMPEAGLLQELQMAAADIRSTTGVNRDNLGEQSNAQSGRAILSRQREGDVGTYVYIDNLARAVAHCGRILVDLIPKIYDTERQVRILGEDGKEEFVAVNQRDPMSGRIVNDLSAGRYDVVPSVGPSFSTRREEGRESMMAFMQAYPPAGPMIGDLFAEAMDWPGATEIAKRLRKAAVAQGIAEPQDGERPPPPPPPSAEQILAQAEMQKAQNAAQKLQLEAFEAQTNAAIERAKLALEAEKLKIDVGHLQLDAIETRAKISNDTMTARANAVGKTVDTIHKAVMPRQQPGNQMQGRPQQRLN